jgi:hypothetical protein
VLPARLPSAPDHCLLPRSPAPLPLCGFTARPQPSPSPSHAPGQPHAGRGGGGVLPRRLVPGGCGGGRQAHRETRAQAGVGAAARFHWGAPPKLAACGSPAGTPPWWAVLMCAPLRAATGLGAPLADQGARGSRDRAQRPPPPGRAQGRRWNLSCFARLGVSLREVLRMPSLSAVARLSPPPKSPLLCLPPRCTAWLSTPTTARRRAGTGP